MTMAVTLFLKECKIICKSVIYLAFILAMILFYTSQIGDSIEREIEQYYTNEEYYEGSLIQNMFIKPQEGAESYGTKYAEVPEKIMPKTIASLVIDWKNNYYTAYPLGFFKSVKLNDKKQAEMSQIITDVTGINAEELYDNVFEIREANVDDNGIPHWENLDYTGIISIKVTYDEFKEKMKRVDNLIGGGSPYSKNSLNRFSRSQVPVTYEEKLAEYNAFIYEDKITGAFARMFCDYMGIIAGMLSMFIPSAFLMRDKRARANELVFSRSISSAKLILVRYAATVLMLFLPFIVMSLLPLISLTEFAVKNNLPVDVFAFAKYITAWILPTLMTTTAVGFILTIVTDTPVGIIIQFVWSFINLAVGAVAAMGKGYGTLINYGMNLMIRHNSVGFLQVYKDEFAQLVINRVFYTILSVALVALTVFIYEQKRRGFSVRVSMRKIFRNRQSAD